MFCEVIAQHLDFLSSLVLFLLLLLLLMMVVVFSGIKKI